MTIDTHEMLKFSKLAQEWWDPHGALKTLHDINHCRIEFINRQIKLDNLSILDIGCGGGILTEVMATKSSHVHGIDPNSDIINVAKQHANEKKLSVEYICTDIADYNTEQFDVITCMDILEHVQDPEQIIFHCNRLLKPDGYLFFSTLNRTCSSYIQAIIAAEYILKIIPKQTHDYIKFIKPSELAKILREYNFVIKDITGITYNPFTRSAFLDQSVQINYLLSSTRNI